MSKLDIIEELEMVKGAVESQKADLTYQVAEGTATVITLNLADLTNGYAKTFIASANNVGSATTINGKSLYKPNTTTAPKLIAGKAYTVWYNSENDCFFIKASAEGNVVTNDVLAGKTFSNDNDTGLIGTMDLSKLTPDNIRKGVTINGVTGNKVEFGKDDEIKISRLEPYKVLLYSGNISGEVNDGYVDSNGGIIDAIFTPSYVYTVGRCITKWIRQSQSPGLSKVWSVDLNHPNESSYISVLNGYIYGGHSGGYIFKLLDSSGMDAINKLYIYGASQRVTVTDSESNLYTPIYKNGYDYLAKYKGDLSSNIPIWQTSDYAIQVSNTKEILSVDWNDYIYTANSSTQCGLRKYDKVGNQYGLVCSTPSRVTAVCHDISSKCHYIAYSNIARKYDKDWSLIWQISMTDWYEINSIEVAGGYILIGDDRQGYSGEISSLTVNILVNNKSPIIPGGHIKMDKDGTFYSWSIKGAMNRHKFRKDSIQAYKIV